MLAYQLGDEFAFIELYNRHSRRVFGFLKLKLRDETTAHDVFQSTFMKLHKCKNLYNSSLPFSPWLFTICRSELLDFFKKQKMSFENFDEELIAAPNIKPLAHAGVDLSSLSSDQQVAIHMRYMQDSTFEEIASALNTSPLNARQIVSRSIKYLRGLYDKKQ